MSRSAPSAAANPVNSVVSLGTYARAYWARVLSGDSGVLPVVVGLMLISIVFQTGNSHFLTAENLVNWLQQASLYMVMAMGIVFVLLLGEIDLSVGYVGLLGGAIAAEMLSGTHPWPLAIVIVVSLGACAAIGFVQGLLITRLGLPSFVVTLAGLAWVGRGPAARVGQRGTVPINDNIFDDFATGHTNSLLAGWVIIGALVAIYAVVLWFRDNRRRSSGLVAPPVSLDDTQDRRNRRGRGGARPHRQRQPQSVGGRWTDTGPSLVRARGPGHPAAVELVAEPDQTRPLYVRHRG